MPLVQIIGEDEGEQREWPRYEAADQNAEDALTFPMVFGDKERLCKIKDISLGGARLSCDEPFPNVKANNDPIVINHPKLGPVQVEQCWRGEKELGVTFDFSERALDLITQCIASIVAPNSGAKAIALA